MELPARCDSAGFLMCSIGTKILITPEICTSVVFRRSDSLCRGERLRCFDTNAQIPPAKVFLWKPRHDASGSMHLRSREDENRFETARSELSSGAFRFVFCQTNTPRQSGVTRETSGMKWSVAHVLVTCLLGVCGPQSGQEMTEFVSEIDTRM